MSLALELADDALRAAEAADAQLLNTFLLSNLVVAAGARPQEPLLRAIATFTDSSTSGLAYRLSARMHFRTQDDFDPGGRVHVGAVVIPALLAIDGVSVLEPMAAGYSVLTRVARVYRDEAEARGLRPTGMFGPIGAAAAAGVALGLDRKGLGSAIAISTTMCAGTNQSWVDGTDEWVLEVAASARAGVEAAMAAQAGMRGAQNAFEGRAGWAPAFFGDGDAALLAKVVGDDAFGLDHVSVKAFPVSGIAQVPTALASLMGKRFDSRPPERLEIRVPAREFNYPGSSNRGPFKSRSDSLMSIARCCALAYANGKIPLRLLAEPPLDNEETVLKVTEVVSDSALAEGAAELRVSLEGNEAALTGHDAELLHPTWEELGGDLEGLAERCEIPVERAECLHDLVAGAANSDSIRLALQEDDGSPSVREATGS